MASELLFSHMKSRSSEVNEMTVRLVKRGQKPDKKEEQTQPKETDMVLTMQSWVEEFKSRKNQPNLASIGLVRRQ